MKCLPGNGFMGSNKRLPKNPRLLSGPAGIRRGELSCLAFW